MNCRSLILPVFTLLGMLDAAVAAGLPKLELRPLWTNAPLQRPIWFGEAPDDSRRRFVVEQRGRILILPADPASTNTGVFLDVSNRKPYTSNEEGLLGLAFHPGFRNNGRLYVYYSQAGPRRSVLSEFKVAAGDRNRVDPASERILLEVPQPYANHNGGCIAFGPDGFLYVSLGDGGAANDPHDHGQNLQSLLGKMLRIDVDAGGDGKSYGIPRDNPFAGRGGGVRPEIWAYGLRNVWRFSFDRPTGDLWAGDVGQNKFEEVDLIVRGGNYGWNWREAFHGFKTNGVPPADARFVDPVIEYPHLPAYDRETKHTPGISITGGHVYRGRRFPQLQGVYLYADFAVGTIWGLRREQGRVVDSAPLYLTPKGSTVRNVASFGEDAAGELYATVFEGTVNGRVCELIAVP